MSRLAGRRVLITGASSGVGRAATDAYASAGAHVALMARGVEGLQRAALSAREHDVQAVVVPADVTDRDEVDAALAEAIARLGGLDVLVSCAAATVFGDFSDVAARDFDRTLEVSFLGAVNVTRAVLPELERHDGAIVTVGSILSRTSIPTFSSYCAAKHALRAFYEALSVELRPRQQDHRRDGAPRRDQHAAMAAHLDRHNPPHAALASVGLLARGSRRSAPRRDRNLP